MAKVKLNIDSAPPPGARYVTLEDSLRVDMFNSVTGIRVQVTGRLLLPDGTVTNLSERFDPTDDRASNVGFIRLQEGWILDIQATALDQSADRGDCWVDITIFRGFEAVGLSVGTLLAGYVGLFVTLSYPNSPVEPPVSGHGAIKPITGTNPAAGAEVVETVPAGARWRIIGFSASLVTSATAANRTVSLIADDGGNAVALGVSDTVQTAGQTRFYFFAPLGAPQTNNPNSFSVPFPPVTLPAGFRIRTATSLIEADDDWGIPRLLVEEWKEPT